ncbi:putative ferric-chelate reductase 1 [Callorhinchus milii]|uniref:putative ferric-chelate reductase 1 n=1 Tax=Callorhinchus milii TaxID=7868 RepID=UPI001C3FD17C|nr:putative ferric-chelate reductase 1 [Callorhinchus milii]
MGLHVIGVFTLLGIILNHTVAFENGRVTVSCETMTPDHGSTSQRSPSPFIIRVDKDVFIPGDQIKVTLTGRRPGTSFEGFLLQARDATDMNSDPVGTFILIDKASQLLACGNVNDSAVSHTSSSGKHTVTVLWNSLTVKRDQVQFLVTVVQKFNTYWVQLHGPVVSQLNASPLPIQTPLTVPSSVQLSKPFNVTECGSQSFCLRDPPGCDPETDQTCCFFSFAVQGRSVLFQLSGPSQGYVSFALSGDQSMGADDIYLCIVIDQSIQIHPAHSTGRSHPILNSQVSIYDLAWRLEDGVIKCSFRRNIQLPEHSERFDLDKHYYIFLAEGRAENGRIEKHHRQPLITQTKVYFAGEPKEITGSRSPLSIKAHGALMFIGWVTTVNVGVVVARFFKPACPTRTLFGERLWFQVHRILMGTTVLLTCIGCILPFLYRGGWSHHAGAHPYFGCAVLTLIIIQPILAIFRPHPQAPRRYIFDWTHWGMGTAARAIALAAMFLGMDLPALDLHNPWDTSVMVGFITWHVMTELILETHNYLTTYKELEAKEDKMNIMVSNSGELNNLQVHALQFSFFIKGIFARPEVQKMPLIFLVNHNVLQYSMKVNSI